MIAPGPVGCFYQLASRERTPHQEPWELIPGVNSSKKPPFLTPSQLPPLPPGSPTLIKRNWGELGFQHSNGRKWFWLPHPLPHFPSPPSTTTTQFSQDPGRGGRKQDIPPGGLPLSLTRVIAWTLSPSTRWRPHQDGKGLILEP